MKCPLGRPAGDDLTTPILLLAALLGIPPATGGARATECDRIAAHPDDPDRVAPGVERNGMDLAKAAAACEAQLATDPANARIRYQLARVLFYSGQQERAVKEMRAAADAGYRQAQFVFGAFISNRRDHAPQDVCLAEHYWLLAARNGRQAARVSYVRHYLNGRFDVCDRRADTAEMMQFLDEAAKAAGNYYEGMLIEDLAARLGAIQQQVTGGY